MKEAERMEAKLVKRPTAHEQFVEAMRALSDIVPLAGEYDEGRTDVLYHAATRQAAESFADAECHTPEHGICRARAATGGLTFAEFMVAIDREHASCRAALLKEIFG